MEDWWQGWDQTPALLVLTALGVFKDSTHSRWLFKAAHDHTLGDANTHPNSVHFCIWEAVLSKNAAVSCSADSGVFFILSCPQPAERFPSSHFAPLCDPEAPRAWWGVCRPLSCPQVQKCPLLEFLRTGPLSHSLLPPQAQLCSSPIFTKSWLAGHP